MASADAFQFEFQSRALTGHGAPVSMPGFFFANVLRVELDEKTRGRLPRKIILKTAQDEYQALFDNESRVYEKLAQVQGKYIPDYYGIAAINGSPAHLLSDIGGITMEDEAMPSLDEKTLREGLKGPLEAIRRAGIILEDVSLKNMHYCDGLFMPLDFEHAKVGCGVDEETVHEDVADQIDTIMGMYHRRQKGIQEARRFKILG
ncbi:hypothetical protein BHE90_016579 [Fusarium euwallaceae]|uniref:Protein kinase domain-containing protein n=1 Tax=Fusarium euwallaceae TaxID=1147111 RepID=A0A430KZY9_9HYPO|nr:hypothetical protein BHE90_016579 [Fusarium euwallaceae]